MMIKLFKIWFVITAVAGFMLILGTAGADCDGKCMENSLTILQIIEYCLMGFALMVTGIVGYMKLEEYENGY